MLNDERFIQTQINCVLDKGECDETGAMIKRNIVFLLKEIYLVKLIMAWVPSFF